jgi:carbonic anhydrase/acetyltransferase-like protein (isoleucine patch superfamily)
MSSSESLRAAARFTPQAQEPPNAALESHRMADIVLFGAGQLAEVAKAYIDAHGPDRVVGFTVDVAYLREATFHGLPVVAWEELEQRFPPKDVELLGPISFRRLNEFRRDRHLEGKARGYRFASFIHPAAHIYAQEVGENAFILEGNIIQPFARIGQGAMMFGANAIGHHTVVGDYCFVASHVAVGGAARVGELSYLSLASVVESGVMLGPKCFLDVGAVVKENLPAGSVVRASEGRVSRLPSARMKRLL